MVNELPSQIEPLFTDTIGLAFTVTELTANELTQPAVFVPVTEYEAVAVGETTDKPPETV